MKITVYTTPNCVQCNQTKRFLASRDVDFDSIDVTTNKEAHEYVTSLGYSAAPVVVAGNDHWSGFRYERLQGVVAKLHLEEAK